MKVQVCLLVLACLLSVAVTQEEPEPTFVAVRFFHAVANGPEVTVFFDDQETYVDVDFAQITDYVTVQTGVYNLALRQDNNGAVVYQVYEFEIPDNDEYITLVFQGSISLADDFPFNLAILADQDRSSGSRGIVRYYHAAATYGKTDLYLNDAPAIAAINFGDSPKYQSVSNTVYDVYIADSKNGDALTPTVQVNIPVDFVTTIFFVGAPRTSSDRAQVAVVYDFPLDPVTYSSASATVVSMLAIVLALLISC
jgi:hypothetical protein